MILSAHFTSDTKIVGLPNFAPHWLKSVSVKLLARQQPPTSVNLNVFGNTHSHQR